MPMISEISAYPVDLPLKFPFETAKGYKVSSSSVIVEVKLSNGICGIGSATPAKYVTNEDPQSVLSAIKFCTPELLEQDISCYQSIFKILKRSLPDAVTARASLEIGILDAFCKLYNLTMYHFFGGCLSYVETDVTIPIAPPETCRELARLAASKGFKSVKVKVGTEVDEDLARVVAVYEGAPNAQLRLDANQGFTPALALHFLKKIQEREIPVELMEQPVDRDDIEGLAYVTKNSSIPIFADEAVITARDAWKLIKLEAVNGINVKLMKSGISDSLDIIAMCKATQKELMLGSMIETNVGIATAVHFACGTGMFSKIDLDSYMLVVPECNQFVGGYLCDGPKLSPSLSQPGHGAVVNRTTS